MQFIYQIGLRLYQFLVKLSALFGNEKAQAFVQGRKNQNYSTPNTQHSTPVYWFHCASLGEFEQGKPLMKAFKTKNPDIKILLTFFSPSGYEQKKNESLADWVLYLPLDTLSNAQKFITIFKPEKAFFVKYEVWPNYFFELKKQNIPLYLVSASFRKNQVYFKWYGKFFRKALRCVTHIFVQNEASKALLSKINILSVSVVGDTRFDNVTSDALLPNNLIDDFCKDSEVIIMGSSWSKEEQLMSEVLSELPQNVKLIIAPHDISKNHIQEIEQKFSSFHPIKFSKGKINDSSVLIVDAIGVLKYAYSQSSIAIVGGGFKNALHNILEPAACGLPVLYGNKFEKFPEGNLLINAGGGFAFKNTHQLKNILEDLLKEKKYQGVGKLSKEFVESNKGATEEITREITN